MPFVREERAMLILKEFAPMKSLGIGSLQRLVFLCVRSVVLILLNHAGLIRGVFLAPRMYAGP